MTNDKKHLLKEIRKILSFLGKGLTDEEIIHQSLFNYLNILYKEKWSVEDVQDYKEYLMKEHQEKI